MTNEQLHHIEVGGNLEPNDPDISLTCRLCDWNVWVTVGDEEGPTLAELEHTAGVHLESAHPEVR